MSRFFWKGPGSEDSRGRALIASDVVCWLPSQRGLWVLHLNTMNVALLTKWAGRIMSSADDLVTSVLTNSYVMGPDWER